MDRPKTLTAAFVRTISQPGRYGDGRGSWGLYLRVHATANGRVSKSWAQRLRIGRQFTNLGLGSYPLLSLADARARAIENAKMVAQGDDPRAPVTAIPTFADAIETVIGIHGQGWRNPKTAKQWQSSLDTYAMPKIGRKLVSEIDTADIMAVLTPIWTIKHDLAKKVRQRIGAVMRWAVAQGHRADDPTGKALGDALPKTPRSEHYLALPFADVGTAIQTIRGTDAWWATRLAFEYLVFTSARSGEARLAEWTEIDLDAGTWTIPATRMKAEREHRVPLSRQAVATLRQARVLSDGVGLVFPSERGKALSDATISKLVRENGIAAVPHGFRSSFRDWAAECSDVPREIAEHALAHVVGSASERAYRRTDYFEKRRVLMQEWADFLSC